MLAVCAFFVRVVWSVINFVHCLVSRGLCGWKKIKTPKGRKKIKFLSCVGEKQALLQTLVCVSACAVCKCACFVCRLFISQNFCLIPFQPLSMELLLHFLNLPCLVVLLVSLYCLPTCVKIQFGLSLS